MFCPYRKKSRGHRVSPLCPWVWSQTHFAMSALAYNEYKWLIHKNYLYMYVAIENFTNITHWNYNCSNRYSIKILPQNCSTLHIPVTQLIIGGCEKTMIYGISVTFMCTDLAKKLRSNHVNSFPWAKAGRVSGVLVSIPAMCKIEAKWWSIHQAQCSLLRNIHLSGCKNKNHKPVISYIVQCCYAILSYAFNCSITFKVSENWFQFEMRNAFEKQFCHLMWPPTQYWKKIRIWAKINNYWYL